MRRFTLLPARNFDPSGLLGAAIVLGAVAAAEIVVRFDELVDRLGNGAAPGGLAGGGDSPS